jgi:hypothetical protein
MNYRLEAIDLLGAVEVPPMSYFAPEIGLCIANIQLLQVLRLTSFYHFGGNCSELLGHSLSGILKTVVLHSGQLQEKYQ